MTNKVPNKMTDKMIEVLEQNEFGEVKQLTGENGMHTVEFNHTLCQGKVSLYGGQVLSWQPTGQEDVFWLSNRSEFKEGKAIRGGIPLCWPWFGGYKEAGNHGFARTQTWLLSDIKLNELGVELTLSWQGSEQHALWPYPAKLQQTLFFAETFKQQLLMENLSDQPVQYTGALHSYFNISQPKNVQVAALNNVPFDCKLTGNKQATDNKENVVGLVDRIYYTNHEMEIRDSGLNRSIMLTASNTQQWVLWNPGHDVAATMADIHEGGENEFVCLEAANTEWQDIAPKQCVEISQTIALVKLS